MEITNGNLRKLQAGLAALRPVADPIIANRVGNALRQIAPFCETIDENEQALAAPYLRRTADGGTVAVLDDAGVPTGAVEVADTVGLIQARRPLYREVVTLPELKGITYAELEAAGVEYDGNLVELLGDFLTGEPLPRPAPRMMHIAPPAPATTEGVA